MSFFLDSCDLCTMGNNTFVILELHIIPSFHYSYQIFYDWVLSQYLKLFRIGFRTCSRIQRNIIVSVTVLRPVYLVSLDCHLGNPEPLDKLHSYSITAQEPVVISVFLILRAPHQGIRHLISSTELPRVCRGSNQSTPPTLRISRKSAEISPEWPRAPESVAEPTPFSPSGGVLESVMPLGQIRGRSLI